MEIEIGISIADFKIEEDSGLSEIWDDSQVWDDSDIWDE